jgi:hypothetical protein
MEYGCIGGSPRGGEEGGSHSGAVNFEEPAAFEARADVESGPDRRVRVSRVADHKDGVLCLDAEVASIRLLGMPRPLGTVCRDPVQRVTRQPTGLAQLCKRWSGLLEGLGAHDPVAAVDAPEGLWAPCKRRSIETRSADESVDGLLPIIFRFIKQRGEKLCGDRPGADCLELPDKQTLEREDIHKEGTCREGCRAKVVEKGPHGLLYFGSGPVLSGESALLRPCFDAGSEKVAEDGIRVGPLFEVTIVVLG